MNTHRNQIEDEEYRKLKVSRNIHFCSDDQFEIFPFHKCFQNCNIYREEVEEYYRKLIKVELH